MERGIYKFYVIDASSFGVNQETALVFKLGPDGARHKNAPTLREKNICVCNARRRLSSTKLYISITRARPVCVWAASDAKQLLGANWKIGFDSWPEKCNSCLSMGISGRPSTHSIKSRYKQINQKVSLSISRKMRLYIIHRMRTWTFTCHFECAIAAHLCEQLWKWSDCWGFIIRVQRESPLDQLSIIAANWKCNSALYNMRYDMVFVCLLSRYTQCSNFEPRMIINHKGKLLLLKCRSIQQSLFRLNKTPAYGISTLCASQKVACKIDLGAQHKKPLARLLVATQS